MPKFEITKTITQTICIEVEEPDYETAKRKVDNWDYEDLFEEQEEEYSSERESDYIIREV